MSLAELAELLDPRPSPWEHDPIGWVSEKAEEFLWSKERQIMEAVRDHRLVAVHACHDSSKSHAASRLAGWWIDTHPIGSALVVTTATTGDQVKGVLWQEIGTVHERGNLRGRTNQTEWWIGERLVGVGRKPSEYNPTAFQGYHREHVLAIIDEADGVPASLWEAMRSVTSNEGGRILAIGNPVDPTSEFARVCGPDSGWHVIHIDGFDTPNFTDEDVPPLLHRMLLSKIYVDEARHEYGEGSPYWESRVRGRWPVDAEDGVVQLSAIRNCQHKDAEGQPIPAANLWTPEQLLPVELGVDVGAGGDQSVVYLRRGPRASLVDRRSTPDEHQIAGMVLEAIRAHNPSRVKVDATGVGWAVGGLVESMCAAQGIACPQMVKVMVGESSTRKERFPRLRDQLWWEIGRELSQSGGWDLSEVDEVTVAQLVAPKYHHDAAGRTNIEKKDETKKRLGRSPDDADALLLAFYVGARPGYAFTGASREL